MKNKFFLQLLCILLGVNNCHIYAPPKKMKTEASSSKVKKQSGNKAKKKPDDSDDDLLDGILASQDHQVALAAAKKNSVISTFKNYTPTQQKQIITLNTLLLESFNAGYCFDKLFSFIENIKDPVVINAQFADGKTPLITALQSNNVELVRLMLKNGANVDGVDNYSSTALMFAIKFDQKDMVALLLSYNPDIFMEDNATITSLMVAVLQNNSKIVSMLLDYEAKSKNKNAANIDKLRALNLASDLGYVEIVKILLSQGTSIKQLPNGETPLLFAAKSGNEEIVRMLLKHNFSPNLKDLEHLTALMIAAMFGHANIIKILLQAHADPFLLDLEGNTALDFAKNQECVELLENAMPKQNLASQENNTPKELVADQDEDELSHEPVIAVASAQPSVNNYPYQIPSWAEIPWDENDERRFLERNK